MVDRLGKVIYWAASALAVALLVGGALAARGDSYNPAGLFTAVAVMAALIWLAGRAVRYVLSGN